MVMEAFDEAGITIPLPQQEVRLVGQPYAHKRTNFQDWTTPRTTTPQERKRLTLNISLAFNEAANQKT